MINHMVNFGWEYVWHCHILSHEEMDMMHALSFAMPPAAPSNLAATYFNSGPRRVALSWVDNAVNETSFTVQRADTINGPWVNITTTVPQSPGKGQTVTYNDTMVSRNRIYYYRVMATNTVGDTTPYTLPAVGYPTMVINSDPTPVMTINTSASGTWVRSSLPTPSLRARWGGLVWLETWPSLPRRRWVLWAGWGWRRLRRPSAEPVWLRMSPHCRLTCTTTRL